MEKILGEIDDEPREVSMEQNAATPITSEPTTRSVIDARDGLVHTIGSSHEAAKKFHDDYLEQA